MLRFKCPNCEKALGVKEQLAGKKVVCPHCKAPFTVPAPKVPAASSGNGSGPRAPAMGLLADGPGAARQAPVRVSFPCPHCRERLKIPLDLAGKQRPCPRCKKPMAIPPVEELKALATGPSLPADIDLEDLAASAFAEPTPGHDETPQAPQKIDMTCHFCDENVQFDVELSGKQAPCPVCKNILKVPVLKDVRPKDWREKQVRGPSLAKDAQAPALKDAWGTATDRGVVSGKSLVEAGVIVAPAEPVRPIVWVRRVLIGVAIVAFLGIVYYSARLAQWNSQQSMALKQADDSFEAMKTKLPRAWAAFYRLGTGEFLDRSDQPNSVSDARDRFVAAFGQFLGQKAPLTLEEDLLLVDIALAQVDTGGDDEQARAKKKLLWKDVQKEINRTLGLIKAPEVKLLALRQLYLKLQPLGQEGTALGLATQVQAAAGGEKADVQELLQAEKVALLMQLKKNSEAKGLLAEPDLAKAENIKFAARLAYAEAAAYEGDFEQAQRLAQHKGEPIDKVRTHLAIADIALAKKNMDAAKTNLEQAKKIVTDDMKQKAPSLVTYQIADLCLRTGAMDEAGSWLDHITDAGARARGQLLILKARAAKEGQPLEATQIENDKALAYAQAVFESFRAKARLGQSDLSATAQSLDEQLRPFAYLGIVIGTQDRQLGK